MTKMSGAAQAVALILAVAGSTAACGEDDEAYVGVCVNPQTGERMDDDYCEEDESEFNPLFAWWWISSRSGYSVPPLGGHVEKSKIVTKVPSGASYKPGGLPTSGGSIKNYMKKGPVGFTKPKTSTGGSGGYKAPAPSRPKPAPAPRTTTRR